MSSHAPSSNVPPHGNFPVEPVAYRGPYEYSVPGMERDFLAQFEPDPIAAAPAPVASKAHF